MKTGQTIYSSEGKGIERKETGKAVKKDLRQDPKFGRSSRGGNKHTNRGK